MAKKYIDADRLIAEIKRYKNKADNRLKIKGRTFSEEQKDLALQNLCGNLLHFITSLQQEQPEVDLEEALNGLDNAYFDLDGIAVKGATYYLTVNDLKDIARDFYELGLKTKNKYV